MWRCTVCQHVELGEEAPPHCPVCDSEKEKFVTYQPEVGGTKTWRNLKEGFIGESQATIRNLAFARKADEEGLPQMAKLFRAVAAAEEVHAYNNLMFLDLVKGTQENLDAAFQRENLASIKMYPRFIAEANEENAPDVALSFSHARDVEQGHGKLYKKAMQHLMAERETTYYVCQTCGYVSDGILPDECPVCGAPKSQFKTIE
jgi:rubrerythrin